MREPSEVALGSIPSSVNLPLTGFEKSLSLDEGEPCFQVLPPPSPSLTLGLSPFPFLAPDSQRPPTTTHAGDFTRVHGFHKPEKTQPIIFYCKAGIRAQTAVDLAKRAGFK